MSTQDTKCEGMNNRLLLSSFSNKLSGVRAALDKGADPSALNSHRETPLHGAAQGGDYQIAKLLLNRGVDPSAHTVYGETPLYYAAFYGHPKIVKLLLERGASPSETNRYGETVLQQIVELLIGHDIVSPAYRKVVELLLENGADPLKRNRFGYPVVDYASLNGNDRVAKFLEDAMVKAEATKEKVAGTKRGDCFADKVTKRPTRSGKLHEYGNPGKLVS